jgi:hypothetical protein
LVAALEVITDERVRQFKETGLDLERLYNGFQSLRPRQKLTICALLLKADADLVTRAQAAVDRRHDIVHEGKLVAPSLEGNDRTLFVSAVELGSTVCTTGPVRFVELFSSNQRASNEYWDS